MAARRDRPDLAVPPPPVPASEPESLLPAVSLAPPTAAAPDGAGEGPEAEAEDAAGERAFTLTRSRDTDKLTAYIDLGLFGQLEEQVAKARYRHRKRKPLIGHVYDAVIAVGLAHMDEVDKLLRGLR